MSRASALESARTAKEQELNKQIAADSTKETSHSCCDYQSEIKILLIFSSSQERVLHSPMDPCTGGFS